MDNQPIIEFKNVTKSFSLLNQKTFKEFLPALFSGQETQKLFTALSDISFKINRGDTLGIIGPNGSGKSTILKLIAGVMSPTSGKVIVRGKISPLIELGAGFHPELTGKENIYLNGAILGLPQKIIEQKFQDILSFSELDEFIDQPIKHYSSGMYMRLGFSVAINSLFDILIIDEILAVGDFHFQQKCFEKIRQFQNNGKTIILVSHDIGAIRAFCNKSMIIKKGEFVAFGKSEDMADKYIYEQDEASPVIKTSSKTSKTISHCSTNQPKNTLSIVDVEFLNLQNEVKRTFLSNDSMTVIINYSSLKDIEDIVFGLAFYHENSSHLYGTNTLLQNSRLKIKKGKGSIRFIINNIPILQGKIFVTVAAHTRLGKNYDWKEKAYSFNVFNSQANSDGYIDFNAKFLQ